MSYPSAHGGGGYAISHHRSKVLHMADYESLRRKRSPIPMPWDVLGFWLLGVRTWLNIVRDERV
jgi:hypothetical protein